MRASTACAQRVVTALRFLPPGGTVARLRARGRRRASCGSIRAGTRRRCGSSTSGSSTSSSGADHLLFLLCLVIPFRRLRALVPIVTAFTVAHSITLIASAYGYAPDALWFPPLIETLIAASIVYMALENIVVPDTGRLAGRWIVAFGFGLVHGFGFSFGLQHTLQFAGSHLLTSLLSFNVGVEIGQLLVLCLLVPALDVAVPVRGRRAHGHDRPVGDRRAHGLALDDRSFRRAAPVSRGRRVTAAGLASGMRWLMLLLVLVGVHLFWRARTRHWSTAPSPAPKDRGEVPA